MNKKASNENETEYGDSWKIRDKHGIEMPDDWAITPRTYDKVKRLLDKLNINGEYRPYTMVQIKCKHQYWQMLRTGWKKCTECKGEFTDGGQTFYKPNKT